MKLKTIKRKRVPISLKPNYVSPKSRFEEEVKTDKDFQNFLDNFDWFYMMSDDYRVWSWGEATLKVVKEKIRENPKWKSMFEKKEAEVYNQERY